MVCVCVDKRGVRQDFELVGDQVHELNKLTVIASGAMTFAKGLKRDSRNTQRQTTKSRSRILCKQACYRARGRITTEDDAKSYNSNSLLVK